MPFVVKCIGRARTHEIILHDRPSDAKGPDGAVVYHKDPIWGPPMTFKASYPRHYHGFPSEELVETVERMWEHMGFYLEAQM